MEEAVYGDVLDVLVELRDAVRSVPEMHDDADAESGGAAPLSTAAIICQEQSPALLDKLNGLVTSLEAVMPHLSPTAVPPTAATALRTLVTRKLGDVMESAHHVRSLVLQATSASASTSTMSTASTSPLSEHRASELRKARQVFRSATQNLDDAQRLLRIAYPGVLASPASNSIRSSNRHEGVGRYSVSTPTDRGTSPTGTDEPEGSRRRAEGEEEDDGRSVPRASDHTAPYFRRSESREVGLRAGSADSLSSSVLRDEDGATGRRASWGSLGSGGDEPSHHHHPTNASGTASRATTAPPSATRRAGEPHTQSASSGTSGSQWWFDFNDSSAASSARRQVPRGATSGAAPADSHRKADRRVSFMSAHSSADDMDRDRQPSRASDNDAESDFSDGPLFHDATMRYRTDDAAAAAAAAAPAAAPTTPNDESTANMTGSGGGPALDLAYFQFSSPLAAAKKHPTTAAKCAAAPTGLPPKPPVSALVTPPPNLQPGSTSSATASFLGGSAAPPGGSLSPSHPHKPTVNPDGTHTTRHTLRLPGGLWGDVLDEKEDALHEAMSADVMDLFNYGAEVPQIRKDGIRHVVFSFADGALQVSFALVHKASLSAPDIDLRMGVCSFPEMTALYEDHFLELRRNQLAGERSDNEEEVKMARSTNASSEGASSNIQSTLAKYNWPAASDVPTVSGNASSRSTDPGARRASDGGVPHTSGGRGSAAGLGDSSSGSDRTLSVIPENSPVTSLTPTSAAVLRHFQQRGLQQQQQQHQEGTLADSTRSSHHSVTIPGRHWSRVVLHVSERVCRLLVVDEIASALNLPSTAVEQVKLRYGSLIVDFDLFAGPEEPLPPAHLVDHAMSRCAFPVLRRVYNDTCQEIGLPPDDADEHACHPTAAAPSLPSTTPAAVPRQPGVQLILPDMETLDRESDEDSTRRRRANAAAAAPVALPEPQAVPPLPSSKTPAQTSPPIDSPGSRDSLNPPPQPAVPAPVPRSSSRQGSQETGAAPSVHTPPRQAAQRDDLQLTPMDDEPPTLLHLSLVHDVPLPVLREWNPHLARYADEAPIPDTVTVTVPRAYGLTEEGEEGAAAAEEQLPAEVDTGAGAGGRSSLVNRGRASTGSPRPSIGGSRPRDNVKFVAVANPSAKRAAPSPPPPHQQQQPAVPALGRVDKDSGGGVSSGHSTPMVSPRDWQPTPAPPPDPALLLDRRRSSAEPQPATNGKMEGSARASPPPTAAPTPAAAPPAKKPKSTTTATPASARGGRASPMPPPLAKKAIEEPRQESVETAARLTPHSCRDSQDASDKELTPHQQRMLKAQPPPLSPSLVDSRQPPSAAARASAAATAAPPKDAITAAVEKHQPQHQSQRGTKAVSSLSPPEEAAAGPRAAPTQRPVHQRATRPQLQPGQKPAMKGAPAPASAAPLPTQPAAAASSPSLSRAESRSVLSAFPLSTHSLNNHSSSSVHLSHEAAEPKAAGGGGAEESVWQRLGLVVDAPTLTVRRARGPAARAGFRPGDIIRTIDGKAVHSVEDVGGHIASGQRHAVFITVQEGGDGPIKTRHVVLSPIPATAEAAENAEKERPVLSRSVSRHAAPSVTPTPAAYVRPSSVGASARRPPSHRGGAVNGSGRLPPPPATAAAAQSHEHTHADPVAVASTSPLAPEEPARAAAAARRPQRVAVSGRLAPPPLLLQQQQPPRRRPVLAPSGPAPPVRGDPTPDAAAMAAPRTRIRSRSANPSLMVRPLGPAPSTPRDASQQ